MPAAVMRARLGAMIYLVTRADLPPGQQAVQAAHALHEFIFKFPGTSCEWHRTSGFLVLLAAENESVLLRLADRALLGGIEFAEFREYDYGDALTAVAFAPSAKELLRKLPLALKGVT